MKPALAAVLSLALLGCGAGTPSTTTPRSIPALAGDWSILATATPPATPPQPGPLFTGALSSSGTSVSGTLRAYSGFPPGPDPSSSCISPLTALLVSGTVDAAGNLTLTVPIASGTATITSTLATDHHTFASGSFTIAGGDCAMPATPMRIVNFLNATGTYTGTLNQYAVNSAGVGYIVPGTATPITVTLTEATIPNDLGGFPVTGSVTATGACPAQFTLNPGTTITGGALTNATPPSPPFDNLYGAFKPDASSLFVGPLPSSGACDQLQLQGTLTPQ